VSKFSTNVEAILLCAYKNFKEQNKVMKSSKNYCLLLLSSSLLLFLEE